jgi:hypothetical protein
MIRIRARARILVQDGDLVIQRGEAGGQRHSDLATGLALGSESGSCRSQPAVQDLSADAGAAGPIRRGTMAST